MKVLLTGATGFLGFRTLEQLVELDEVSTVRAAGRTLRPTHFVDHPKVDYQLGDLLDEDYVAALVKGCDVIIHAAALSSPWGPYEAFWEANVEAQRLLLQYANRFGVQKFIYVSTPSLYFELKDKAGIREQDPLPRRFINAYAATKREAEQLLDKWTIPYIAIRPRALIGRGDTVIMPRLIRAYEEGKLRIIGTGENLVDLTPVANVAHALILGLQAEGEALNQIYNISNGTPVPLWDKIQYVLKKLGKAPLQQRLPFWLVRRVAQVMELRSKWTDGQEPPLTVYGVGTLAKTFTLDISKARNLLGYEPRMSVDEAIDEFVKWYLDEGN
jgi:nucleoside-diphosphate-sugar epimerase